ncbi:MAG TPA: SLC13 family permease, partial [Devosiaceae bacterium]
MNALTILPDSAAMWATLGIILVAMLFYGFEWASIELVSLGALVALMALGMLFPLANLSPDSLLTGFSNPAMITILALLVTGQALIQTEALSGLSERLSGLWPRSPVGAILLVLLIAGLASSVVNNTPIVVVFIPVLAAILSRREMAPARYMMSLSFASILGGMTTLLGSSTNLLAAGVARAAGVDSVTFFSFTVPGLAMAAAGGLYVLFVVPRIVADNSADQPGRRGRAMQFITEIRLTPGHPLIGD